MKFEIRVEENREEQPAAGGENTSLQTYSGDVSIDIGQVLAANQALLKNINRRMEEMESRMKSLEVVIERQAAALQNSIPQRLLLMAPPKPVKPWTPDYPALDESWFGRFSLLERWFQPHKLRRRHSEM